MKQNNLSMSNCQQIHTSKVLRKKQKQIELIVNFEDQLEQKQQLKSVSKQLGLFDLSHSLMCNQSNIQQSLKKNKKTSLKKQTNTRAGIRINKNFIRRQNRRIFMSQIIKKPQCFQRQKNTLRRPRNSNIKKSQKSRSQFSIKKINSLNIINENSSQTSKNIKHSSSIKNYLTNIGDRNSEVCLLKMSQSEYQIHKKTQQLNNKNDKFQNQIEELQSSIHLRFNLSKMKTSLSQRSFQSKRSVNFSKVRRTNQQIKPELSTNNMGNFFEEGRRNYVLFLKKIYYSLNNDEKTKDKKILQG